MGNDTFYVYGDANGASYLDLDGDTDLPRKTHWDSRLEVKEIAGVVQVGIIPPSDKSTDDGGIWDPEDGRFLSLDRGAVNRLIEMLREARNTAFGADA